MRIFILILIFNVLTFTLNINNASVYAYGKKKEFKQLRSSHFLINYRHEVDERYIYKVQNLAEKYYRVITQDFNLMRDELWLWENRAVIFIAKDKADYQKSFKCQSWSTACVDYRKKIIYTYYNDKKFESILAHEMSHIIFIEYVKGGELPLWLQEGMAVYIESKYGNQSYIRSLPLLKKKIKEGKHIPLKELNKITPLSLKKMSQEEVSIFYIESFSLVEFIMKRYGSYKFYRFLYNLRHGYTIEKALSRIFYHFRNFDLLEEEWKEYYQK